MWFFSKLLAKIPASNELMLLSIHTIPFLKPHPLNKDRSLTPLVFQSEIVETVHPVPLRDPGKGKEWPERENLPRH